MSKTVRYWGHSDQPPSRRIGTRARDTSGIACSLTSVGSLCLVSAVSGFGRAPSVSVRWQNVVASRARARRYACIDRGRRARVGGLHLVGDRILSQMIVSDPVGQLGEDLRRDGVADERLERGGIACWLG